MREYKLPSGKASIETTGGLLATKEFTVPSKASERNLALREALEQCLHLSAQCGQAQLQRDIAHESVKQLTAGRGALLAALKAFRADVIDNRHADLSSVDPYYIDVATLNQIDAAIAAGSAL